MVTTALYIYSVEKLIFIYHCRNVYVPFNQNEDAGVSTLCSYFNGIPVLVHRVDKSKGNQDYDVDSLVHAVTYGGIQPRE